MTRKQERPTISGRLIIVAAAFLSITANCLVAQTWTNLNAPYQEYFSVACSADGSNVVALGAAIDISTNSGETWGRSYYFPALPQSAACSADGSKIFTGGENYILRSTNSGGSWATNVIPPNEDDPFSVRQIACSADGSRVAVAVADFVTSNILYSSNSGAIYRSNGVPMLWFASIVSSADGSKLIGTLSSLGNGEDSRSPIYRSVDYGVTWTATTAPVLDWLNLASSADGTKLAAVGSYQAVWLSTNSGLTWLSNSASYFFSSPALIACSADGTRLVVAGLEGADSIYTSLNSGQTWTTNTTGDPGWTGLAMSADGSFLVASSDYGMYATYIPAQPSLTITPSGSNLTLCWPLPSTGFVLQESGDLTSGTWAAVTNSVIASNEWNQVTVSPPAAGNAFYRLSGP